jgi:hypothetical protein
MKFIYGENEAAKRVGLSKKALRTFRSASMEQGKHWEYIQHQSRKKTALSAEGVMLLISALKNGALTGGEPVRITPTEIIETAILSGMPTGSGGNIEVGGQKSEDGGETGEKSEKKPPIDPAHDKRPIRGLLPAPPGCKCGPPITATLIVHKDPSHYPNKKTIVCRVKEGQMPDHHLAGVTDQRGLAYCRVKSKEKFIVGMEVPAQFENSNVWSLTRPCPRRRGRW